MKVKALNSAGFKNSEIAKSCSVTNASVTKWDERGEIPEYHRNSITKMVTKRQKKVIKLANQLVS